MRIIDEIVIVKRNTEFVHLNPFIIEVNILVKPTIFTVNTESNYCHFQLSINRPDLVGRATRNMWHAQCRYLEINSICKTVVKMVREMAKKETQNSSILHHIVAVKRITATSLFV